MLLTLVLVVAEPRAGTGVFRPGQPWRDTMGKLIDAHGGGMLEDSGRFCLENTVSFEG